MATQIVEGFSISHAAILDGSTGAEEADGDIYGIRSGSIEVNSDSYDNTGDDAVLSTWYWLNYADISVQSGYVPFATIALLSGATVTSSGTAPNDYYYLPYGEAQAMNQSPRPMLIRCPSKDSAGTTRVLDFVFYKVQFSPISFEGPEYKDGLLLNYSGRALISSTDETGASLANSAIGRLISKPS